MMTVTVQHPKKALPIDLELKRYDSHELGDNSLKTARWRKTMCATESEKILMPHAGGQRPHAGRVRHHMVYCSLSKDAAYYANQN